MIGLSKKALCALEAVLDIALHARADPVCMSDLTARQGVPKRYLERVMQDLVHAEILTGHRGPRGGYRLARERRHINVAQILRALEDLHEKDQEKSSASALRRAIIEPLCRNLDQEMLRQLDKITVEDLKKRAEKNGLIGAAQKDAPAVDFHI